MSTNASKAGSGVGINTTTMLRFLPHRYPMLHVDRVLDCVPGERIVGIKNVTRSEPFLARASQGFVLPHLIVVEALAQLSVVLAFTSLRLEQTGQELVFFAGIDEARFTNSASPGHTLTLYSSVRRIKKLIGWFDARAEVEGEVIAVVSMLAAIRRSEPAVLDRPIC